MKSDQLTLFSSPPRSHPDDGIFISFEGIEGAGKSTQIHLFQSFLENAGYQVLLLREPGGTPTGEALRDIILNQTQGTLSPLTEAFIFAASRTELLNKKILPTLKKKKTVVIVDRYLDSSLSYQGAGRQLGIETILKIHQQAPLTTLPHKTFFLHITEETSYERQKQRGDQPDYFEKESQAFYQRIRKGFEQLISLFPQRIVKINAEKSPEKVHEKITQVWESFISEV